MDTPEGKRRAAEYFEQLPYPHFEPYPGKRGLLVRIEANGKRTVGRFVHRRFEPVKIPKTQSKTAAR